MGLDLCRFCQQFDRADNLVDPCDCYKKFDALRVHKQCLEDHIAERRSRMKEGVPEDRPEYCAICRKAYRVKLSWKFGTKNLFSLKSFQSYFEGATILMTFCMMLFAVYLCLTVTPKRHRRGHRRGEDKPEDARVILPMAAVTCFMFVICLRKIYQRWRHQQMEVTVVDVV
ncbi:hypothetical protein CYMTET_23625 [Cymbomonas tetramitiformis]|uniref:RING-CH-type domain-containing protein n=1 Tax=Cymbomonas tetramitiformis TaxID=36881 RepID=A0AAE0FY91_9CHLO|nr:hypothetical protein CYMTET_23625 [Cymbomonas tetramitiformis]